MPSLTVRMKMIQSKMNGLEWSQQFSHFKSMGITPQSLIRSSSISNSFEVLWTSLLSARMKEIQSKMKALEWSQESVNRQTD